MALEPRLEEKETTGMAGRAQTAISPSFLSLRTRCDWLLTLWHPPTVMGRILSKSESEYPPPLKKSLLA